MYEDAHNTIKDLLKNPFIKSITFTKNGKIKVKFTFCQNKVIYQSMIDLLESLEKIATDSHD
jgi:hypothetical protein